MKSTKPVSLGVVHTHTVYLINKIKSKYKKEIAIDLLFLIKE